MEAKEATSHVGCLTSLWQKRAEEEPGVWDSAAAQGIDAMLSVISTPARRLTTMRDVVADVPWPAERDGMKEPQRGNRGGD